MNKIEALKQTIENVESGKYHYDWTHPNSCNCGVVARTLLDGALPTKEGFFDSPKIDFRFSAFCSQAYCITTDLPLSKVFKALKDAGFTIQELNGLEQLNNKEVLGNLNIEKYFDRSEKENLLLYLKAWVKILEAAQPKQEMQKPKEIIRYVSVSESLKEQTEERLLKVCS